MDFLLQFIHEEDISMNQQKIGKLIAKLRKEKGLTQAELGEKLGVGYKAVSKWENGNGMPDVSLFQPLCDILGISVDEFVEGEEKKTRRKLFFRYFKIALVFIVIILAIVIVRQVCLRLQYPKIVLSDIEVQMAFNTPLEEVFETDSRKIYYYQVNRVLLKEQRKTYDLKDAISHRQINISLLESFYEEKASAKEFIKNADSVLGTTLYQSKDYSVLFCDTSNGNRDVYFGSTNLMDSLNGFICGHDSSNECSFVRTYRILEIHDHDDYQLIYVTLEEFQGQLATVIIPRTELEIGKNYEFRFQTYRTFDDTIENIFKESRLLSITETENTGLAQTNDVICVNP